jgi:hypothetical protein
MFWFLCTRCAFVQKTIPPAVCDSGSANYERQRGRRSFERRVSRNTARGGRRKHKFVVDLERGKLYHRGINRRNCVCLKSWKSPAALHGGRLPESERERERKTESGCRCWCRHKAMTGIWYTRMRCCTHPLGASFGATWSRWERGCRRSLLPAHFFHTAHTH